MNNYNQQSHTTWDCSYHVVVVLKYRKSKPFQAVRREIWEIMRELSKRYDFEIVEWNVAIDRTMLLRIAPKYSVSWIVWILKWKSAIMLHNHHWKKKMLWQKNFWSRWYFVSTVRIDIEVVKKYIANQNKKDKVEDWE